MVQTSLDIAEFFGPEHFVPQLRARSKDGVLKELTAILVKSGRARDGDLLLDMLRQREELGSTGIGKGVAIPHGRSLAVTEMAVVFARSKRGVAFDAVDEEAVNLFFLIVAPPNDRANLYLPFLGKLVEIIKSKKNRSRLLEAADFDEVVDVLRSSNE